MISLSGKNLGASDALRRRSFGGQKALHRICAIMAEDDVVDMDAVDADPVDDDGVDADELDVTSSKVSGANDLPWVEK